MAVEPEHDSVPSAASTAAQEARELHARLFPVAQEPGGTPEPAQEVPDLAAPVAAVTPDPEPEPIQTPAPDTPEPDEEETYKSRYDSLRGKFNKLTTQFAELEKKISTPAPTAEPDTPATSKRKEELLQLLHEKYDDELVDYMTELQQLQIEEVTSARVQPIEAKVQQSEDEKFELEQHKFTTYVTTKAPHWEDIWQVAEELKDGLEVSDHKIANFLLDKDPSGLYRNFDLLYAYEKEWDADKFVKVCNMYLPPGTKVDPIPVDVQREAMIAPARSRTADPVPPSSDKKIWTMSEFKQFTADVRAGRVDEATKDALWLDVQTALAEGRIRG
jgi:hypothetical protein